MNRKTFCLYPFAAFSVDNSGKQRICCNNNAWDRVAKNTPISDVNFDFQTSMNNPLHTEVRKFMINDERHPSCKKCWDIEDEGHVSFRQWFNEGFNKGNTEEYWLSKCDENGYMTDIELVYLDITFGNKCNLKCVMCNESNSTLILKEQFENNRISKEFYAKMLKLDWFEDSSILESIFLKSKSVKQIHIVGGEPLLIDHVDFLQKFVDSGQSKNIVLSYNTNLTTLPSKIIDCWKKFKKVYLCVSVDGYKDLNEFIRFPISWTKLVNNIREVDAIAKNHNNITIQIHSTFSTLNCTHFVELLTWIDDITKELSCIDPHPIVNYVFSPKHFDPVHLPDDVKATALLKYLEWESSKKTTSVLNANDLERYDMIKSYFTKMVKTAMNISLYKKAIQEISYYETVRGKKFPNWGEITLK
jgi:molybdenum cofactor biosynthesis enzyme MoaA